LGERAATLLAWLNTVVPDPRRHLRPLAAGETLRPVGLPRLAGIELVSIPRP
jgi:hypothetical protein